MILAGKIALVTGGSSGIGASVARTLAREGACVAVVASKSIAKAESVCADIRAAGGSAKAYVVDVTDALAVADLIEEVCTTHGGLDILVNSAGVFYPTVVGECPSDESSRMIDINIKGVWNCINSAFPKMKERGGGKVINVSSVAAYIGTTNYAVYCASKAAITMLTRSLARDRHPDTRSVARTVVA